MSSIPIPYDPAGSPVIEKVPFDDIVFHTVTWKVPSSATYKGKIIFVHGFAERSEIYTEFFDKLSQSGYEVFFFDQRGAGQTSPGKEMGKTNEFHTFKDLDFMIKLQSERTPNEKFHLMGHSMGGGIVLNYGIIGSQKSLIKTISCTGPLILLHPKTQPNILARNSLPLVARILPNFRIDSKLNYGYITSNKKWLDYIANGEQLIGSMAQFNDMFNRGTRLTEPTFTRNFDPKIPILIFHGTADYINDIKGTEAFVNSLPKSVHKTFVPIEKGKHSLFIETDDIFNRILNELFNFLN